MIPTEPSLLSCIVVLCLQYSIYLYRCIHTMKAVCDVMFEVHVIDVMEGLPYLTMPHRL
jgi:hypothetical protein